MTRRGRTKGAALRLRAERNQGDGRWLWLLPKQRAHADKIGKRKGDAGTVAGSRCCGSGVSRLDPAKPCSCVTGITIIRVRPLANIDELPICGAPGVQTAPLKKGRGWHAYLDAPWFAAAKHRSPHAVSIRSRSEHAARRAVVRRRRDRSVDARREPGKMASRAYDLVFRENDSRTESSSATARSTLSSISCSTPITRASALVSRVQDAA